MSALAEFLELLLYQGQAVLRGRPELSGSDARAVAVLERAFAEYALELAGPAIAFHLVTALAAARFVHSGCWFLLNRSDPDSELERSLVLAGQPHGPEEHASADLVLRYLPQVYHRAYRRDPGDRLAIILAETLRRWPLSGVLGDVEEPPLSPLDFGHPGLYLLYAERWVKHSRPDWAPSGLGQEYVELVQT
jgi:MoxR-vWA-beta-propeller ternary system domain bpX4